jgi:[acyl-carrier-protein] S-malonyltransferase
MNCWMYPGQPLKFQSSHHEDRDFYEISELCRKQADFNLSNCSSLISGTSPNVCMQVYGVAMSLYNTRKLISSGNKPDIITQHSMGIYPALAASGVISEKDALEIVFRVGNCMAKMNKENQYLLGCVIGLAANTLLPMLSESGTYVANFNTNKHFLLAGLKTDLLPLLDRVMAAGAFSTSHFDCDAPLHTPLMAKVSAELNSILDDYKYETPAVPLVSHNGEALTCSVDIRNFLHDELLCPVYWERTFNMLKASGVIRFIEVGTGNALKKFNRWIESEQDNH